MKLMMLGASAAQLPAIKTAQALGCEVVTCDYIPDAIGHGYADEKAVVSTFDIDGVLKMARNLQIDGIMTMGTDQPVLTCGIVSNKLGLPLMLTPEVALSVTHKKVMKEKFDAYGLPSVPYVIYSRTESVSKLESLTFPVVMKPVDSQGQRGIFYCESVEEVLEHFPETVAFSREDYVLVESYYPHDEVTVSGWVEAGELTVLAITDRVTFDTKDQIGICLAHTFPSKHTKVHGGTIKSLTARIVEDFGISDGPIYFQMLLGEDGIKVNEIACRIGGAYEGVYMPFVTGFDLVEAMVRKTMGQPADVSALESYSFPPEGKHLSVQLFFSTPCVLKERPEVHVIKALDGVIDCGFNYDIGDTIGVIENATARAGYLIVQADSRDELIKRLDRVYEVLKFIGTDDEDHIVHEVYL